MSFIFSCYRWDGFLLLISELTAQHPAYVKLLQPFLVTVGTFVAALAVLPFLGYKAVKTVVSAEKAKAEEEEEQEKLKLQREEARKTGMIDTKVE